MRTHNGLTYGTKQPQICHNHRRQKRQCDNLRWALRILAEHVEDLALWPERSRALAQVFFSLLLQRGFGGRVDCGHD